MIRILTGLMLMFSTASMIIDDRIDCNILNATHTICEIPTDIFDTINTNEFELINVHEKPFDIYRLNLDNLDIELGSVYRYKNEHDYHKIPIIKDHLCLRKQWKVVCYKKRRISKPTK